MQPVQIVHRLAGLAGLAALRFAVYVWQPERRLVVGVVAVAVLLVVGSVAFRASVREHLEATGRYRLLAENVTATSPPEWVRSDVVADAFERGGLAETSVLDAGLSEQVAHAFAISPWVREVVGVKKLPVGRIQVDLEYRRPAAMVEVTLPDGSGGLIFVDAEGYLLPTDDFRATDAGGYLRIAAENARVPTSMAGTPWGDDRIRRCAALAATLQANRQSWDLYRIVLPAKANEPVRILSRDEAQIIWGALPGAGSAEEASVKEKLDRINEWTDGKGLTSGGPGLIYDVRAKEAVPPR